MGSQLACCRQRGSSFGLSRGNATKLGTRGSSDLTTEEYLINLLVDNFDSVKKSYDEADLETQVRVLSLINQEEFFLMKEIMEMHINSLTNEEIEEFAKEVNKLLGFDEN